MPTRLPAARCRRVGKSELILHFLKDRPGVYFLGKQAPTAMQIGEFLGEAAVVLEEPLLAGLAAESWAAAFDAVVSRWRSDRKLVLALDEFQWIVGASPELPSVLQERWDRSWRRSGKVLLILCGSYVGFMEREVLGKKSPLFGRRTAQILLRPFGYRDAALFHPRYSRIDQARTYFLCGGIPLYLNRFADSRSIEANIAAELLAEYAPLYREADFLLREELREVTLYYAILTAIAAGRCTVQDIARQAGQDPRTLSYYLQQLIELGYVERRYPLTGEPPSARAAATTSPILFSASGSVSSFPTPATSAIWELTPPCATSSGRTSTLGFGLCFERLYREALPWLYRREGVTAAFEVGQYWSKSVQLDVVGLRNDGWTDLGECKWGPVRSRRAVEASWRPR